MGDALRTFVPAVKAVKNPQKTSIIFRDYLSCHDTERIQIYEFHEASLTENPCNISQLS